MELKIAHLYPDDLCVCGDGGNVRALVQRLRWRGIDCTVRELVVGSDAPYADFDLFFMGGGEEFEASLMEDLRKGREDELRSIFSEIAGLSDILIGNEEDFQLALGVKGPEAGGTGIASKIDSFKDMTREVKKAFPNASVFATTLREVVNVNTHLWGAITLVDDEWFIEQPRQIGVLDRIGGGDGFVGGLLYAMLRGWEPSEWVKFGWATGAMATTFLTDYAQPADEEQVWSIWGGNARVKR